MPTDSERPDVDLAGRLRAYRVAARLTQRELARRAGLSVRMIRNLEGGRTRNPHGESVRLLAEALGLDVTEREHLAGVAWGPAAVPPVWPDGPAAMLPPGGLIGRDELVTEIIEAFEAAPCLITLGGLPGVGKTSIAAAVTRRLRERGYEVAWSSGAPVRDGVPAGGRAVLVLDGVAGRADELSQLSATRASYPALRILVTSSQPLRIGAEHRWIVPPLRVPTAAEVTTKELGDVPAVQMFVACLRQRWPGYQLTDVDAPAVTELVRRLDGLPPALKLAAAHARILTAAELLDRYGSDLLQLAGPLREVIGTSLAGLVEEDRTTINELAVFAGSWTLSLAAAMVPEPGTLEPSLDRLSELGLITATQDGTTMRFHVLDSVRQILRERDPGGGPAGRARRRHADVVLTAAREWGLGLNGPDQLSCAREIDELYPDIVAALAVAETHNPRLALAAAAALSRYWCTRSRAEVGRHYVQRLFPACTEPVERAFTLLQLARLLVYESDHAEAERLLRAADDLYAAIGDDPARVDVLMLLTRALREQRRFAEGTAAAVRAFRLAAGIGDVQRTAGTRNNLTFDDLRCGRFEAARRRLDRVVQVLPPRSRLRALVAFNQAEVLRLAGREVDARDAYADAVDLLRPFPEPAMKAKAYSRLAMCECLAGSLDTAAEFLAEARRAAVELDGSAHVPDITLAAGLIARTRGDRRAARRSLRIAMAGFGRQGRKREVVEAGVLLVGVVAAAERRLVADTVRRLCAAGQFVLTEPERQVLADLAN